ncbi:MAG: TRAP transporter small permease [Candidatus Competibacteraceae bacterium]|nr:TRAP transporter small permease [Candidatus Competibacteraceae bacterium]MCB1806233.1 TRAP transporter small permease [Candidatus Competibacteraceae bacterium]MCB1815022.1 TRAP transporter small permease [Candidatus Competibacteraceae bacterium]
MENPITRVVEPVARFIAILCGYGILLLALAVTVEIVGRKLFAFSLQGIDDIGGYVLAITAAIGASYTMALRGHARVDVFLVRMPLSWQRVLNTLAMVTLAGMAVFALWRGSVVLRESIEFQSTATNPLQTPLWQPQSLWLFGLGLFALIAVLYALHAVWLLLRGRPELNAFYGPKTAQDELEAELAALAERDAQADAGGRNQT